MQIENEHLIRIAVGVCVSQSRQPVMPGGGDVSWVIVGRQNVPYTAAVNDIVIDNENVQREPRCLHSA
jgi:hypothetical protein